MTVTASFNDMTVVVACRSCGSSALEPILSLGTTPLANSLLPPGTDPAEVPVYPLDLVRCTKCALVQLGQIVSPARLFTEYSYYSSFSETMLAHARDLADSLTLQERLNDGSLVIEIASNDGYLLQHFRARGIPVLGVEPAQNIARYAREERGIPTVAEFFTEELANQLAAQSGRASVLVGNNVLAHIPNLNGFVRGVRQLLAPDGIAVFEVPYLQNMLDGIEFDTIYHEHGCYFSLTALRTLFERNAMEVVAVERIPIHGGSLRISASHAAARPVSPGVLELLDSEQAWRVESAAPYAQFVHAVSLLKSELRGLLRQLHKDGHRIAAYGASAKGVTLLSYCGIGAYLDFIVDRSTEKQGKLYPVGALPIYAPGALTELKPQYALMLTWNFADEILRQQAHYLAQGGTFVIPVPRTRIVRNDSGS